MKYLVLLRHGRAESADGGDDSARALAPRGEKDTRRAAAWLAEHGPAPEHALVSNAVRTRQTWDAATEELDSAIQADIRADLYLATAGEILAIIQGAPPTANSVIVVGHNPGIETLARSLAGGGSDSAARVRLARGFPTAGLALFELDSDDWSQLGAAACRLTQFI